MVKVASGHDGTAANVAYYVGRPHWGQGYATEAVRVAVRFGFEQDGLDRFETAVFDGNDASMRVLVKVGFCSIGHDERFYAARGGLRSVHVFALERSNPPTKIVRDLLR
jgi:RimJ/RimL family protein N-acetyltransferase